MAGVGDAGLSTSSSLPSTVTSLLPLTTTFTPPASCSPYWSQLWPESDGRLSRFIGNDYPITCYPSSIRPTYSPGLCPSGYVMVTITEYQPSAGAARSSSGLDDDRLWKASCCSRYVCALSTRHEYCWRLRHLAFVLVTANKGSSGMSWVTTPPTGCVQTFETTMTAYRDQILTTSTKTTNGRPTPMTSHITEGHGNSTVLTSGTILADEVVIYWQATDLPKFDSDYASLLATPTATSTAASNPADMPNASGLSTGVKAGIGVGVAVGVILLCVAGFLMYKERHRKEAKTFLKNDQPELVQEGVSETTP
jgi:hypothetical protein